MLHRRSVQRRADLSQEPLSFFILVAKRADLDDFMTREVAVNLV